MRFNFWYTMLALFYIALGIIGYDWLLASGKLTPWIPIADFFLMALAIMRLTQLVTYDTVTQFVRDWFDAGRPHTLRAAAGVLLRHAWCTGLWLALFVVFAYYALPIAWYAILIFALAAVASFLQELTRSLHWSAVVKEKEAQSPFLPR